MKKPKKTGRDPGSAGDHPGVRGGCGWVYGRGTVLRFHSRGLHLCKGEEVTPRRRATLVGKPRSNVELRGMDRVDEIIDDCCTRSSPKIRTTKVYLSDSSKKPSVPSAPPPSSCRRTKNEHPRPLSSELFPSTNAARPVPDRQNNDNNQSPLLASNEATYRLLLSSTADEIISVRSYYTCYQSLTRITRTI